MFTVLVLSTIVILASAAEKDERIKLLKDISKTISDESKIAGDLLVVTWDKNEKTDDQSVSEFLKKLEEKVLVKVKPDIVGLVNYAQGSALKNPESTDTYLLLKRIVVAYTRQRTLGRARAHTKNEKMKKYTPIRVEHDLSHDVSQLVDNLYDGLVVKNVTKAEKAQLIEKSRNQMDAFIKKSIKGDEKNTSKLASRSGNFFYNQYRQQQQGHSASSVAQMLNTELTNSMCSEPVVVKVYCPSCRPGSSSSMDYNGRQSSQGGSLVEREHQSSVFEGSNSRAYGNNFNTFVGSGGSRYGGTSGLTGNEYISGGLVGSGSHVSNYENNHNAYGSASSSYGGVESSRFTNGDGAFWDHGSRQNSFGNGGVVSGSGHVGSGVIGSSNYGSRYSANSHNSHSSSMEASISGSHGSHRGFGGNDIKGTYSGIANLWSLTEAEKEAAGIGRNIRHRENSMYDMPTHIGGDSFNTGNSYSQHTGGLNGIYGNGLGSDGSGRRYGEHYSASNIKSSSSSNSDSSAQHVSYKNIGNVW